METIDKLLIGLLAELKKIEPNGGSILVEAPFEGVQNPIIVPGYSKSEQAELVYQHLKILLLDRHWIETDETSGYTLTGANFSRITDAGHRALARAK
jgi:hypothetical protein